MKSGTDLIKKSFIITAAVICLVILESCEILNPPAAAGMIEFVDYKDQEKIIAGNEGTMAFGDKLVQLGDRAILPLAIRNAGEGPLLITNMYVDAGVFSFVDETFPELPLSLPAGTTISDIFLEFAPTDAGEYTGAVYIDTEDASYNLTMTGTGMWQLTLNLTAVTDGKVVLPIEVDPGESLTATTSTGIFNLECETEILREFNTWVDSGPADPAPEFDNIKAKKTQVILYNHTELTVDIRDPYVYVETVPSADPDDFDTIQAAIDYCAATDTKMAVVVSQGTYDVTGDITMKTGSYDDGGGAVTLGIPIYGGYNTAWNDRVYKTAANRTDTYPTIINMTGSIQTSGSALNDKVVIEGFTITKQTGGNDDALVVLNNGTTARLQYNTISSAGTDASIAVRCSNSAAPLIRYNYINAGSTTADYSESYGIKITEKATPVIYKNSINGGTANGTDSTSYGIFSDFECEPIVLNNTPAGGVPYGITGGSAPDSGGESYGIYLINNGKIIATYNDISGGNGVTSTALFVDYGGYFKLYNNNIHTAGGTTRIGAKIGFHGRIYACTGNGFYDSPDALLHQFFDGAMTDIDDVNDYFHTETNQDTAVDLSDAPTEAQYE